MMHNMDSTRFQLTDAQAACSNRYSSRRDGRGRNGNLSAAEVVDTDMVTILSLGAVPVASTAGHMESVPVPTVGAISQYSIIISTQRL